MNTSLVGSGVDSSTRCELIGISYWTQETHLAGLNVSQSALEIDLKHFNCCQGSGVAVSLAAQGFAKCCDLNERLSRLVAFIRTFRRDQRSLGLSDLLGKNSNDKKNSHHYSQLFTAVERWRNLHANGFLTGNKGRLIADVSAITLNSKNDTVLDFWPALSTLIWHNGLSVLPHRLSENVPNFSNWKTQIQNSKNTKKVIVVHDVRDLWEPALQDEFEQVIAFSCTHELPLWIMMRPKAKDISSGHSSDRLTDAKARPNKFDNAIQKKISRYKSQSIEEWISAQGLSRLRQVCDLPLVATLQPKPNHR